MSPPGSVRRRKLHGPLRGSGGARCRRCKTSSWTCRGCSRGVCEHVGSEHDAASRTCLCAKCSLSGRHRRA